MRSTLVATAALLSALCGTSSAFAGEPTLDAPVRLTAGAPATPINVDVGHAAPTLADFDGDGKLDLLVGQFGDGKLRIYKNSGTNTAPTYTSFDWFMADGEFGKVPAG